MGETKKPGSFKFETIQLDREAANQLSTCLL